MRESKNFGEPYAYALIKGNSIAPTLDGIMYLYPYEDGAIIEIEVMNMPKELHPFALHIHGGVNCEGDNFPNAGSHYNPTNVEHPYHAGDLPSIFSNDGYSYMVTYTNRFNPDDVVGKVIIIHSGSDDFKTQPSGNSGKMMACGLIQFVK